MFGSARHVYIYIYVYIPRYVCMLMHLARFWWGRACIMFGVLVCEGGCSSAYGVSSDRLKAIWGRVIGGHR